MEEDKIKFPPCHAKSQTLIGIVWEGELILEFDKPIKLDVSPDETHS